MCDAHSESSIRAYCDGELPADEAAAIERASAVDTVLRDRIAAERGLREVVGRVMGADAAPASLAERVRGALSDADEVRNESTESIESGKPADSGRRAVPIAGRIGISWSAVAAVLVLIGGAILAGVLLPQIDEWGRAPGDMADSILEAAADHVDAEHDRCADVFFRAEKFKIALEDAGRYVADYLDIGSFNPADFAPLGYEYIGTGPCKVPGFDRSAHLLYRKSGSGPMVSVFVVANTGEFDQIAEIGAGGKDRRTVRVLRNSDSVLLICCCLPRDLGAIVERAARASGCVMDPEDLRVP